LLRFATFTLSGSDPVLVMPATLKTFSATKS